MNDRVFRVLQNGDLNEIFFCGVIDLWADWKEGDSVLRYRFHHLECTKWNLVCLCTTLGYNHITSCRKRINVKRAKLRSKLTNNVFVRPVTTQTACAYNMGCGILGILIFFRIKQNTWSYINSIVLYLVGSASSSVLFGPCPVSTRKKTSATHLSRWCEVSKCTY